MASDRWCNFHEPTRRRSVSSEREKSSGIDPSRFYTKLRPSSASQRQLDEILHLAARNEVVQRRHEFTTIQNLQRETYREVTKFLIFPLQNLAFECFNDMMGEYLGRPPANEKTITRNSTLDQRNGDGEICDQSPSEKAKRIKVERHWGGGMERLKEQYRAIYLTEMYHIPKTFLPDIWSMEPRIFARETSSGKRKYIVGNLGRFLQNYWRDTDPRSRHYYELIPEGTPCRLYFDLEFSKVYNQFSPQESEVLMTEFIDELCHEFRLVHDIEMNRSCVVDLDSSTEKKFSRHLIIHLPNDALFADSHSAGLFVKRFVGRLADELSTGILQIRCAMLAKCLFVKNQSTRTAEQSGDSIIDQVADSQQEMEGKVRFETLSCFVDLGVYTRNRLFRLMGSTKWGKCASAALRIADANTFSFPSGFSNSKFYTSDRMEPSTESTISNDTTNREKDHEAFCAALDWEMHARALALTLVVPSNGNKIKYPILVCKDDNGRSLAQMRISSTARRDKSLFRTSSFASPIQLLDNFFLQLSQRGGIEGKIRTWSHEGSYFFYQMSDNRWCEAAGRAHKSNNIIWNVDLTCKSYWQTCHDPDCRAAKFRGVKTQLPEELASLIDDYLFDQELGAFDEEKVINEAKARHQESRSRDRSDKKVVPTCYYVT